MNRKFITTMRITLIVLLLGITGTSCSVSNFGQSGTVKTSSPSVRLTLPTAYLTQTPTFTPSPTYTPTVSPTPGPTATPTRTPTITPTPTFGAGSTSHSVKDGAILVFIPAGEFLMGSDPKTDPYFYGAEAPSHYVYLDSFWIYQTEVTNAMYQACVSEGACPKPTRYSSNTRGEYYGVPRFDDYPVVYVSWRHASAYCKWAGGRLPTEAEWEKAARGTDGRLFPWGNEPPQSDQAQFGTQDTTAVGSFPAGASPYGVLDMSGNVIEWEFDYFQSTYYRVSPYENPKGPASGSTRVYRGGSYHNLAAALRTVMRGSRPENYANVDIGFRCAVDATEP